MSPCVCSIDLETIPVQCRCLATDAVEQHAYIMVFNQSPQAAERMVSWATKNSRPVIFSKCRHKQYVHSILRVLHMYINDTTITARDHSTFHAALFRVFLIRKASLSLLFSNLQSLKTCPRVHTYTCADSFECKFSSLKKYSNVN